MLIKTCEKAGTVDNPLKIHQNYVFHDIKSP